MSKQDILRRIMSVSKFLNLPTFVYKNSSYLLYISGQLDSQLTKEEMTMKQAMSERQRQSEPATMARNAMGKHL